MSREPTPVRVYRALLRLYPPSLRRAHADEMVEVVRRRWAEARDRSGLRRAAFVARTWGDAVLQAGIAWLEEGGRAVRGVRAPDLLRELRVAGRSLARSPGFTAVAVVTLALGIGANTAIFTLVETVLLEPLPFPGSDRLVTVSEIGRSFTWIPNEVPLALEASDDPIGEVAGFYPRARTVTGGEHALQVEGAEATPDLFGVLGVELALGRGFTGDDARPGAPPTAVLGPGLWRGRFGGAPDVVGRQIRIDGTPHRIVGVLAREVPRLTPRSEAVRLWTPVELVPTRPDGSLEWTQPVIRLAEGVSLERAQAELDAVWTRFQERHPDLGGWAGADRRLETLRSALVRNARPALLLLQLAVAAVLLLACVNVANLLLVRAGARRRELAVRAAMGASRGRLLRHLLSESLVLALLGGTAALALVVLGIDVLSALVPETLPRVEAISVDASILAFTLAVSLATGVVFGLVPAAATLRRGLADTLEGGGRTATASRRRHRLSQGLVVAQVTLTLVLLVGAGLMLRSFDALTERETGFRAGGVVAVSLHVSTDRYHTVPRLEEFYRRVRERVAAVPGVESVAVANYLPHEQGTATRALVVEGRSADEPVQAQYGVVSPDYFRTLGIPVLRGRGIRETDRRDAPGVAVVNEALARELWPRGDAVGRRVRFQDEEAWRTVVGVVGNVRGDGLAREPRPGFYVSYRQRPADPTELVVGRNAVLLLRTPVGVEALAGPLREAVWEVEPRQPVPELASLERLVSRGTAPERFRAVLLGGFAAVALLLVVSGIYGVVATLVSERTREFGIRVAMGATGGDIVGRVLRWGLRLTALGVALGLGGVLVADRYLESLLFQVAPTDPATLAGAVAVVATVALAACLIPARRATRVDPVRALRAEGGGPESGGG